MELVAKNLRLRKQERLVGSYSEISNPEANSGTRFDRHVFAPGIQFNIKGRPWPLSSLLLPLQIVLFLMTAQIT